VERQIVEALALDPPDLIERARVRDRHDPRFLQEECLVYLIRECNREARMRRLASDLAGELLLRIEGFLGRELRRLGPSHYEEASDEVVAKLFEKIADQQSDLGDFAQVSFWTFLAAKVSDAYRKHLTRLRKEQLEVAPPWVYGSEPASESEQPNEAEWEKEPAGGASLEAAMLTEELLRGLPEHYCVMMKLHLAGWPIESKDDKEETISRHFGKTPRTINNWLRDAQRQLVEAWKRDAI
jgi:DNA-directed RNA polymerase specialized sigma24 family protein